MKVTVSGQEINVTRDYCLERAIVDALSADINLKNATETPYIDLKDRCLRFADANSRVSQAWMAIFDRLEPTRGFLGD